MRGGELRSEALFSYLSCEERVPLDLRCGRIQKIVDEALGALTGEFESCTQARTARRFPLRNCFVR